MVRMFVRHTVSDFGKWKKSYDAFDAERKGMGVEGDAVFQTIGNPREVTIWHDFETADAAHAFADSARLREVMAAAGVSGAPTIWYTTRA